MPRPRHDRTPTQGTQATAGGLPGATHDPAQPGPPGPMVEPSASPQPAGTPSAVTACGQMLYKGKEGKANFYAATRSVPEAAQLLGCSVRTARRWLQRGQLPGRKLGRDWVVDALLSLRTSRRPGEAAAPSAGAGALAHGGAQLIAVGNGSPPGAAPGRSFSPGGRRAA